VLLERDNLEKGAKECAKERRGRTKKLGGPESNLYDLTVEEIWTFKKTKMEKRKKAKRWTNEHIFRQEVLYKGNRQKRGGYPLLNANRS